MHQKIPEAIKVRAYREKLLNEEVSIWDLVTTKHLSKKPEQYSQNVSQVIAARQIIKDGGEAHSGGNIKFVFLQVQRISAVTAELKPNNSLRN